MKFTIVPPRPARLTGKRKVTCLTCNLKRCVGHCRFEPVDAPHPPKGA